MIPATARGKLWHRQTESGHQPDGVGIVFVCGEALRVGN
jgi:hypothetical protein